MVIFHINHHFPMVFPWFSHGFPMKHPATSEVSPPSSTPLWRLAPAPRVLALVQRLERESCERCEASEKVGTGGGMEVKLGNIQLWLLLLLLFLLLLLLLLLFIVITIFFLLIKAKLSGWGKFRDGTKVMNFRILMFLATCNLDTAAKL